MSICVLVLALFYFACMCLVAVLSTGDRGYIVFASVFVVLLGTVAVVRRRSA